ncbi:MAG: Fe-S cluster assembly protein SufD [Rhabdochlamydiaceae bacterium]|jgi:Fe-S cluster assembly protein SufD
MSTTSFFASLQEIFSKLSTSSLREKAWDHFLELGLPDKSTDAFKYVPLKRLYDIKLSLTPITLSIDAIRPHIIPEAEESYIVFANGRYSPELSRLPPKVVILPMQEALKTYGPFLQGRLSKGIKEETDSFAVLNLALQQDGVFCYLPPKLKLEKPLQVIYYGKGDQTYHPARLNIFCSADSELKTISTIVGGGVHHISMDAALEERAIFSHLEISKASVLLSDFKATLKSGSNLKHLSLTTTGSLTRNRLRVSLLGEQAEALLQGLWSLLESHQCHTHVHVEHAAPSCRSLQKFKGVLKEQSQSSFEGKIYVHPIAQKTEAYQLNHNLLLSDAAIANAKPNLEIFADDVKASHGATMSEVDDEQLFYLQSRGISKESARSLLIRGFIQEIIDQIPYASIRDDFRF